MRLLDRYVLGIFLSALLIFSISFLALFLIVDFSWRLPRFLSLTSVNVVAFMLKYYAVRLPLFALYVLPTVSLFAAMFALVRLQKSNELVPIVTSGVSMHRVAAPFLVVSVLLAVGAFALDEFVLPDMMTAIGETDEILLSSEITTNVNAVDRRANQLYAREYNAVTKTLSGVAFTARWENHRTRLVAHAKEGRFDADRARWVLSDGTWEAFDREGNPIRIEEPGKQPRRNIVSFGRDGYVVEECDITLKDLQRRFSLSGRYETIRELNAKIREFPDLTEPRLSLHRKFSFPLSCVVLLLLGLPFVVQTYSKSIVRGLLMCMLVTACYYVVHLVLIDRAGNQKLDPVVASWGSTVFFGIVGVVNFSRMKS
jgi:lipopolysaccharide export LptBFGC system permease protein LptF